jgi:hypothetical protein
MLPKGSANPYGMATADFNGDGRPDLAVTSNDVSNLVSILFGYWKQYIYRPSYTPQVQLPTA